VGLAVLLVGMAALFAALPTTAAFVKPIGILTYMQGMSRY